MTCYQCEAPDFMQRVKHDRQMKAYSKRMDVENLLIKLAEYFDSEPELIRQRSRKGDIVRMRQISIYVILDQLTPITLGEVGLCFGYKDHTMAIHCRDVVRNQLKMKHDNYYKHHVRMIEKFLNNLKDIS